MPAVHPLARASPFFRSLPLAEHGVSWVEPDAELAHPLDNGRCVMLERSLERTGAGVGGRWRAYAGLMAPPGTALGTTGGHAPGPLAVAAAPAPPGALRRGRLRPARALAQHYFAAAEARALFAGLAAHAVLPLDRRPTAAFGLILALLGHAVGWPLVRGGSQRLADAMASYLEHLGGEIRTHTPVASVDELPASRVVLLDVTPRPGIAAGGGTA